MDEGFFPFAEFARLDSQDRAFIIRSINSQAEVVHGADDSFPFEGFLKLSDEARESIIEEIKKQNSGNSKTKSGFQSPIPTTNPGTSSSISSSLPSQNLPGRKMNSVKTNDPLVLSKKPDNITTARASFKIGNDPIRMKLPAVKLKENTQVKAASVSADFKTRKSTPPPAPASNRIGRHETFRDQPQIEDTPQGNMHNSLVSLKGGFQPLQPKNKENMPIKGYTTPFDNHSSRKNPVVVGLNRPNPVQSKAHNRRKPAKVGKPARDLFSNIEPDKGVQKRDAAINSLSHHGAGQIRVVRGTQNKEYSSPSVGIGPSSHRLPGGPNNSGDRKINPTSGFGIGLGKSKYAQE